MRMLPPGTDVKFPDVPDTGNTEALIRHLLRSIASGVGLPYELLAGDLSQVNYSSAKLGLEAFKRRVTALRVDLARCAIAAPAVAARGVAGNLTGRLHAPGFERDPEPYFKMTAMWPGFAALDPFKEATADIDLLNAGLRSRAEIIAARGRDIADVDAEIASDTFVPRMAARPPNPALIGGHQCLSTLCYCATISKRSKPATLSRGRQRSIPTNNTDRGGDRDRDAACAGRIRAAHIWKSSIRLASILPRRAARRSSIRIGKTASTDVLGTVDDVWLEGDEVVGAHPLFRRGRKCDRSSRTSATASSAFCRSATRSTQWRDGTEAQRQPHAHGDAVDDPRGVASSPVAADPQRAHAQRCRRRAARARHQPANPRAMQPRRRERRCRR